LTRLKKRLKNQKNPGKARRKSQPVANVEKVMTSRPRDPRSEVVVVKAVPNERSRVILLRGKKIARVVTKSVEEKIVGHVLRKLI
jgi:hypothetical protein